jgi:hypothetical protein
MDVHFYRRYGLLYSRLRTGINAVRRCRILPCLYTAPSLTGRSLAPSPLCTLYAGLLLLRRTFASAVLPYVRY